MRCVNYISIWLDKNYSYLIFIYLFLYVITVTKDGRYYEYELIKHEGIIFWFLKCQTKN